MEYDYKNIKIEKNAGVAIITFNRPKVYNALSSSMLKEINTVVDECNADKDVKILIFTGEGRAFVAGADISQMKDYLPYQAINYLEEGHNIFRKIEALSKPSIAAVNGMALGGGTEIALACDLRFVSKKATFGLPEITLGIIPGWGGTQRLSKIIGIGRAKEMILSGDTISAQRAYEIGLANRIISDELLLQETNDFAKKIATHSTFAMKMAKDSINFGYGLCTEVASKLENQCTSQCFSTHDQKEGMQAFLEKRKATFIGY
ncbi:crotonase [Desulfosarcina widdelii]|uniref:Crotonase n=1 Tax=Desulfosarcina widdelii TaxID=947919 RepID=A0A5K7YXG8_9BACT|nr:enoyl-CoA hydratase-related protein [Desulfosarcina widdelii]BBO73095.1 crotonase [Desulfosarcina widdelii]